MFLENLSETILFGKEFAQRLKPFSILLLKGPIGSGKTSFVQGIAEGLSIDESITSPTFALSHRPRGGLVNKLGEARWLLRDSAALRRHP